MKLQKCIIKSNSIDQTYNQFNFQICQSLHEQGFSTCKECESRYASVIANLRWSCSKDESGNYCLNSKSQQGFQN